MLFSRVSLSACAGSFSADDRLSGCALDVFTAIRPAIRACLAKEASTLRLSTSRKKLRGIAYCSCCFEKTQNQNIGESKPWQQMFPLHSSAVERKTNTREGKRS